MRKPTHILGATAVVMAAGYMTPVCLTAAAVGGLLPDIDHPKSALGHKNPVSPFLKHRGFFHSLAFTALIGFIFSKGFTSITPEVTALVIGILSHLFLDMLNRAGVQLLWPMRGMIRLPISGIRTGSVGEWIVCGVLLLMNMYFAANFAGVIPVP